MLKITRRLKSTLHGRSFDAVVVGGGHNGLVAAAYLAKAGKQVVVVERRHLLGGAAVTEEIVPGFKFSRASYLVSLLRPQIVKDLELKKHGLKVYLRNPNSFTPLRGTDQSLLLGNDMRENEKQIAQFSVRDAEAYSRYEQWMNEIAEAVDPLLDTAPVNIDRLRNGTTQEIFFEIKNITALLKMGGYLGRELPAFYELITAPASKILDKWFESEPLKATLATDAVIGAMLSPRLPGSGYVLLHHVMGELEGVKNAWGYAEGGNGAVSMAIARAAEEHGATLVTDSPVSQILVNDKSTATGVVLEDGSEIRAKVVLSNATPQVTFLDLLPEGTLPADFRTQVAGIDYTSPVTKINIALSGLPDFSSLPNTRDGLPCPHHQCTIHLNTEHTDCIHSAYLDAQQGRWSSRPLLELCLPSSLDPTLAPPGCHVMSIFSQYTPYKLADGDWTEEKKEQYANVVFDSIEDYAPGFKKLVIDKDILTPPDLERIFGLTGGNIFHGAMSVDQLYLARPTHRNPSYASGAVKGLYLCGSGAHPGGGVMGSPGRLAAMAALEEL
ncbi:pyridine nucleotide-disulfide oxidoreductase domain-containing protein 2-like [Halichondria panicea]|uniref:pyridine nucleotide-disulfide oxidoreductase domain-containing protein 2-like n=1 Tax=Halichondria panicea TaxID=6063 RepID=UPI00312B83A9